jgi:hypothetical protein
MSSPKKKPAATKRTKRKATADLNDVDSPSAVPASSIDLSANPKAIAASLLALLPKDATKQHPTAKKLLKAFPVVVAELEHRANAMARKNESQGTSLPIVFKFLNEADGEKMTAIHIPEDSFVNMFSYLTGKEIVNASIVSKSWLSVSRFSSLWSALDKSSGLTNSSKQLNATALIKLLSRPQVSAFGF